MVTKSLVKLIDEAIIPALILVVAKMVGVFLASYFLHLPYTIESGLFLKVLPTVHFSTPQAYILAENYSNLAMFVAASLGTFLVISRAHFFHESHIHPRLHAKLISLRLESLVAPSYHLYHQATIWLVFLWMVVGFLILSSILGVTYPQIAILATIIAANFSWIFATDVEREIEITRIS